MIKHFIFVTNKRSLSNTAVWLPDLKGLQLRDVKMNSIFAYNNIFVSARCLTLHKPIAARIPLLLDDESVGLE